MTNKEAIEFANCLKNNWTINFDDLEPFCDMAIEALKNMNETSSSDKISYSSICDKFPSPHIYFNTYDEAERWAIFNKPNYRPYYIIKRLEHFEIVGEVR